MATNLNVKSGRTAVGTGSATTTVSGLGFTPKAVIAFATARTTSGSRGTPGSQSIGFSDGTHHRYVAWAGDSGASTSNVGTATSDAKAIGIVTDGTPTVTNEATIGNFQSGSFDIVFNSTPAAAYFVCWIALGG